MNENNSTHQSSQEDLSKILTQYFDDLVSRMNQAGCAQKMKEALFADSAELNKHYRPGKTETNHGAPPQTPHSP